MTLLTLFYIAFGAANQLLLAWSGDPLFRLPAAWGWIFLPAALFFAWHRRAGARADREPDPRRRQALRLRRRRSAAWAEKAAVLWIVLGALWTLRDLLLGGRTALEAAARAAAAGPGRSELQVLALAGIVWFVALAGLIYVREWLKLEPDGDRLAACRLLDAWSWLLLTALAALGLGRLGVARARLAETALQAALLALPCLEILLRIPARLLGRRDRRRPPRSLLDLYLFELAACPGGIVRLFRDALDRQLGFQVAGGRFLGMVVASLPPLALLSLLLLWLLSGVVVLPPGFQAVVLRFGRPTERVLEAGLHCKAPWPVDAVRAMDVWRIRRIRVGSHRPADEEAALYREDVPILWTNNHGVTDDELLIVAPPRDLMQPLREDRKTPSVSLVGADVTVEYRIADLPRFLLAGQDVEAYFRQLAMQAVSRALFRYDVDQLFCLGRIELPPLLHRRLQDASDRLRLGIEVLHVGLGGVHPPQQVAGDFQSTVSARQRKITIVEEARQDEIKRLAAMAGTAPAARRLALSEDRFDAEATQADGRVAGILAEARAYRCEKANSEFGKSDRFRKERLLYEASPAVYLNHRTMSSLEDGLKDSRKYMLVGDRDRMILRFRKDNGKD